MIEHVWLAIHLQRESRSTFLTLRNAKVNWFDMDKMANPKRTVLCEKKRPASDRDRTDTSIYLSSISKFCLVD